MKLNITNGESARAGLEAAGISGDMLCWNDVLHDGPVPAGLDLEALSRVRAGFVSSRGWAAPEDALAEFGRRDSTLETARSYGDVVLWFEHDLYDQLQILQILDWFAGRGLGWTSVWLVQMRDYLGPMDSAQLRNAHARKQRVTREQFFLARDAWAAFRSPSPEGLVRYFEPDSHLPCLGAALRRFAEEYPWTGDGLSRTERVILGLASDGVRDPGELFAEYSRTEEAVFLGDSSFFWRVEELQRGREPLLDGGLALTRKGHAVAAGEADRIAGEGIDRWLGGVHLKGEDSAWRWDPGKARFVSRP